MYEYLLMWYLRFHSIFRPTTTHMSSIIFLRSTLFLVLRCDKSVMVCLCASGLKAISTMHLVHRSSVQFLSVSNNPALEYSSPISSLLNSQLFWISQATQRSISAISMTSHSLQFIDKPFRRMLTTNFSIGLGYSPDYTGQEWILQLNLSHLIGEPNLLLALLLHFIFP